MIIGTSTRTEFCQILGKDSQNSLYRKKTGRLTKVQATTGPDTVCGLKYGPKLGKPLRREKKQEWANEKPKLDNAQRMRGIYFVDPEDEGEKLEVHMDATMPSKKKTKSPTSSPETGARLNASNKVPKTKYASIVEAHESTSSTLKITTTTCAGKGYNSMNQLQFGSQVHSYAADHENPGCKGSSGQGMEEARNDSSMAAGKGQEQKGGYSGGTERQKTSTLLH